MNINATFWGQVLCFAAVIAIFFTVKFARGKASNLLLIGFYAFLLNVFLPSVGWIYCGYWHVKQR
ncbi:hypothetical protein D0Y50_07150 [Salinimonas sediminis]|uniref:Uncharacterized protein n=1 Tax=Salinimonas sediminis TaxID=2303538 RepID=A0A346NKV5_9ALTE|nr:hypothetical protein D0Y50_07150 [Salinimonas sediminis]